MLKMDAIKKSEKKLSSKLIAFTENDFHVKSLSDIKIN